MPSFFSNRHGGRSLSPYSSRNLALHVGDEEAFVRDNRLALGRSIQFMNQSHGDSFTIVDVISDIDPEADALITEVVGLAIAVLTADCIPLLLASSTVVAAVHVGRKGLVNGITSKVIQQMYTMGATSIHAQLGPSICGACYEVPQEMADAVVALHPNAHAFTRQAAPSLDLPRALIANLKAEGATYEASPICTLEDLDYFSFRREGVTGRNAGIIWL